MPNEPRRFASAIFASVLVALSPTTAFFGAARAADNCLLEPSGQIATGKHWYYRIEHGTGRHCWYQRGEDEKPARAGASELSAAVNESSRNGETEAARSIANAHAELRLRTRIDEAATVTPSAPTAAADDEAGSVPANSTVPANNTAPLQSTSPWPAPSSLAQASPNPVAAPEQRADAQATPVGEPAVAQPAQAVGRNIGSLQKLFLVAFGALALAGLTGRAVYRLAAGARRRARRKDRWPKKAPPKAVSGAVSATTSRASRTAAPQLVDEARMPARAAPELDSPTPRRIMPLAREESEPPDDRVEKIEDFLARLTKQLEAEMESTRAR